MIFKHTVMVTLLVSAIGVLKPSHNNRPRRLK